MMPNSLSRVVRKLVTDYQVILQRQRRG